MSETWQDLKLLLVGCGSIGKRHARVLTSLGVSHIGACDIDAGQLAALIKESPNVQPHPTFLAGLEEHPAAVFVLTPPKLHVPMAMQAIRSGCHVFCEKPLSATLDGVDELAGLVTRSGQKLMVGHCFRYHEGLRLAKELLDAGAIGRLVSVRALMGEYLPDVRPDYRSLFAARYSGAFDLMHDIDLAIWYAAQPVKRVQAFYGVYSDIGIEAPDVVEILIDFSDRCLGSVHLDFFQRPRRRQTELVGTAGVIIIEFAQWDEYSVSVYRAHDGSWEHHVRQTTRDAMFAAEDKEFLQAVAEDRPITCDIAEGRKAVEVVVAAQAYGAEAHAL